MTLKRLIATLVCIAVLACTLSAVGMAAELTEPGAGAEMDRPNDTASVVTYADFTKRAYNVYEAENSEIVNEGRPNDEHVGFSGTGVVAMTVWNDEVTQTATPGMTFTVDGGSGGAKEVAFGYDNGHGWAQSCNVIINGENAGKLYFPTVALDKWDAYGIMKTTLTLAAGENKVTIQLSADDYPTSFNVDFMAVAKEGDDWKKEVHTLGLTIGNPEVQMISDVASTPFVIDAAPMIKDSLTFIPVRGVFEAAGATVSYEDATRKVTIALGDKTVVLTIDSRQAYVNDKRVLLTSVPFINPENNRTLIPLRFVSEQLGFTVGWDDATKGITIKLS